MLDTVVSPLDRRQFEVLQPECFSPSAKGLLAPPYYPLGLRGNFACVQNPTKADLQDGRYLPRLTLAKRKKQSTHTIEIDRPQRPDCVAGHVGLELRNVDANYPFEQSHRFAEIQRISGFGAYSLLSCGVGDTQLGRSARIWAGCLRWKELPRCSADTEMIRRRPIQQYYCSVCVDFSRQESVCGGHGQQAWSACSRLRRLYPFHIRRKRALISIGSLGGIRPFAGTAATGHARP